MPHSFATAAVFRNRVVRALGALWCITAAGVPAPTASAQPTAPPIVDRPFVEPLTEPMAVIPPGREDFLAEMLGRGEALPGECAFSGGQVESDTVTATYTCSGDTVVVTLRHPTKGDAEATVTEQFALAVKSGSAPEGLVGELSSRVRAREGAFEWTWLEAEARPQSVRWVAVVAAVLLAGGFLVLALRRLRRPAKES